jgi:hypothetical protein
MWESHQYDVNTVGIPRTRYKYDGNPTSIKGETADFEPPGFLGFLRYSQDFYEILGISMGFSGFPWDFQDFHQTPNPNIYYVLYLSLLIEDVQNIFATLLCTVSTVCLHVYSKKIRVCLFDTEKSTRKT